MPHAEIQTAQVLPPTFVLNGISSDQHVTLRLNLASLDGVTNWMPITRRAISLSVDILLGSSFSWGSNIAELQFTLSRANDELGKTLIQANSFSPALTFSSSVTYRRSVAVDGAGYVRLKTTATTGTGDPAARVVMVFNA